MEKEKIKECFRKAEKEMQLKNGVQDYSQLAKYLSIKKIAEENKGVEEVICDDPNESLKFHQIMVYVKDLTEWEKGSLKQFRELFNEAEHVSIQLDKSKGYSRILIAFTVTIYNKK